MPPTFTTVTPLSLPSPKTTVTRSGESTVHSPPRICLGPSSGFYFCRRLRCSPQSPAPHSAGHSLQVRRPHTALHRPQPTGPHKSPSLRYIGTRTCCKA
ncbi:Hypothetical predicted protein [Olea europaea subsp. europaea]|uniref:Uncharacterized protein n=1 Tax=Olea europaea subsp. europaea TaxID=158383 RepID=A0A8S0U087_OLEEU|nr:Hypothetical predicted protein [Olea europaea subsp. europaea]